MKKSIQKERALSSTAVLAGEEPEEHLCFSWQSRSRGCTNGWHATPLMIQHGLKIGLDDLFPVPIVLRAEIEKIVEMVRLNLYNKGLFCGNQAIQWEMIDMKVAADSLP